MAIGVASGSVVITATIRVPSTAAGTGNVTVDTVTTSLSSTLGTVASAIVTLGVPAPAAPMHQQRLFQFLQRGAGRPSGSILFPEHLRVREPGAHA